MNPHASRTSDSVWNPVQRFKMPWPQQRAPFFGWSRLTDVVNAALPHAISSLAAGASETMRRETRATNKGRTGSYLELWEQRLGTGTLPFTHTEEKSARKPLSSMVPAAGLEPARPFGLEILSLLCLPFHHAGSGMTGRYQALRQR